MGTSYAQGCADVSEPLRNECQWQSVSHSIDGNESPNVPILLHTCTSQVMQPSHVLWNSRKLAGYMGLHDILFSIDTDNGSSMIYGRTQHHITMYCS